MAVLNRRIAVTTAKDALLRAIEKLAVPLAEIMVRSGIMVRDVTTIFERACVAVARDKLMDGKKNLTRVTLLTGIDRKKVRRYCADLDSDSGYELENTNGVIRMILSAWYTDEQYLDADGQPKPLTKFGPGACLRDLVETHGKDLSTSVIVTEMLRSDSICQQDRFFLPKKRGFFPAKTTPETFEVFGEAAQDMLETMNYNLHIKRSRKDGRFQKSARVLISASQLPECRREIEKRLDACLIDIDNYLTIKRTSLAEGDDTVRFGVGCYEIQGEGGIHEKH